eukprot:g12819.t1
MAVYEQRLAASLIVTLAQRENPGNIKGYNASENLPTFERPDGTFDPLTMDAKSAETPTSPRTPASLKAKDAMKAEASRYVVEMDVLPGDLGLDFETTGDLCIVSRVWETGAAARWNETATEACSAHRTMTLSACRIMPLWML